MASPYCLAPKYRWPDFLPKCLLQTINMMQQALLDKTDLLNREYIREGIFCGSFNFTVKHLITLNSRRTILLLDFLAEAVFFQYEENKALIINQLRSILPAGLIEMIIEYLESRETCFLLDKKDVDEVLLS